MEKELIKKAKSEYVGKWIGLEEGKKYDFFFPNKLRGL